MGLFNKKKVYCVEWRSKWDDYRRDYIAAKDEGHAWRIIKKQNIGVADYYDNIYEVIPNENQSSCKGE